MLEEKTNDFDFSRFEILDKNFCIQDLKSIHIDRLNFLCNEVRDYLIESLNICGGHFGANLGTVELAVALHYVFNSPQDSIIWDVGHQAYTHKMLTGRINDLSTIRKKNGLAPFPVIHESKHDTFGVGHSSTSISAALGMAVANSLEKNNFFSIAVIGDAALTGGVALEGLFHAVETKSNIIIVLNDNGMSISESVGGLSSYLEKLGMSNNKVENIFSSIGYQYTGILDGHNIKLLVDTFLHAKLQKGPQLIHIKTIKGKGFPLAEKDITSRIKYHAVSEKYLDTQTSIKKENSSKIVKSYSNIFGEWLCEMANEDKKLIGITPAMREGSDLIEFSKKYPERYFDVAIAEQHAITFACGLAVKNWKPVVAIYSTFLQRAYDQVIHDLCLQNLNVTLAIDRAGIVGPDGPTHAGSFDLSFLRCIPNIIIMAPSNEMECWKMLSTGFNYFGPAAIRYPKGGGTGVTIDKSQLDVLPIGKALLLREGKDIAILAFGSMVKISKPVASKLDATLFDMRFIKPLDSEILMQLPNKYKFIITIEENSLSGGAGSAINEFFNEHNMDVKILNIGLPDKFLAHGERNQLISECGLDSQGIIKKIYHFLGRKNEL